jgi:hypothetical protein
MTNPKLLGVFLLLSLSMLAQLPGGAAGGPSARRKPAPQKHALIIAIGDYPAENGWPKLASVQDASYLQKVLMDQGFAEKNITILKDGAATVGGIRDAFAVLTDSVQSGDIVVIHISSHGEQVEADNNNKVDGLDECVVTYNALSPYRSKDFEKDQAEYLRGHVLGTYLRTLRAKLGPAGDLVVFMDNCHSGDGTRGLATVRGGDPPFVSAHFDPSRHFRSDSSMLTREASAYGANGADLASYEVFSATRPEELDYETSDDETGVEKIGSLTYAICRSFESLSSSGVYPTYRQLFARIQSVMNVKVPQQHPLLEGNGADRVLFGGQFVHQQPYIAIRDIDKGSGQILLRQGTLAGLDVDARVSVFPAGTRDTTGKKPLCTGRVVSATSFTATVALDGDLSIRQPVDGWVYVTGRQYKVEPVRLKLAVGGQEVAVRKALEGFPLVEFGGKPELTLVKGPQLDSLKVSGNGSLFALTNIDGLKDKLGDYARYKFIRNLSGVVSGVQVDVRLVLVKNGVPDTVETNRRIKSDGLETTVGEVYPLWIRNTGIKDAYVNILDL